MGRVSREQARENRERVVTAAARLFREEGARNVSVADVMRAAGLTHGGFYKQFASKDALLTEAAAQGFVELRAMLDGFDTRREGSHGAAREDLLDFYLSTDHRDRPGDGCPTTGFAGDMIHEPPSSPAHEAYTDGVREFARWLSADGDDAHEGLGTLCTIVGALLLSRATLGSPLSEAVLEAARTETGSEGSQAGAGGFETGGREAGAGR